jgi:hypothetical protein
MLSRYRFLVLAILVLATVAWVGDSALAQKEQKPQARKLSKDERAQYDSLKELTDAVIAGKQPAPADAKIVWHSAFLRSAADVYNPFILEVEPGKFTSFPVAMYIRAVNRDAAVAAAAPAAPAAGSKEAAALPPTPFEDIVLLDGIKDNKISRALQLGTGNYDIYVVLREKPGRGRNAPAPKTAMLKQELLVPDMFKTLTTSTVILADAIDAATEVLNNDQQLAQPFTISGYKITPSLTRTFAKSGTFNYVFFVYNEGVASDKPDLTVDLGFYKDGATTVMARMKPQEFNMMTLPAEFSKSAGHVISVASGIPLTSFEPGKYRLEIKVTDKTNGASVTRDEIFTVTGS